MSEQVWLTRHESGTNKIPGGYCKEFPHVWFSTRDPPLIISYWPPLKEGLYAWHTFKRMARFWGMDLSLLLQGERVVTDKWNQRWDVFLTHYTHME